LFFGHLLCPEKSVTNFAKTCFPRWLFECIQIVNTSLKPVYFATISLYFAADAAEVAASSTRAGEAST
jgi:hypothetical protein